MASIVYEEILHYLLLAGTQITLTFPSNFDLEKLLASMSCQDPPAPDKDESCEWNNDMEDDSSLGNSLRRKLFGQPERQVC